MTAFSPTYAWQDVPPGAVCPPGLQIETDLARGRTRARIPQPGGDHPGDAVTLLRSVDGGPVNKRVTRTADGRIDKAMAKNQGRFIGRTVPVADLSALARLVEFVGSRHDHVFSLGLFKDAPDEFLVVPKAAIAQRLGADPADEDALRGFHDAEPLPMVARLKINMVDGNHLLFDRDVAEGLPADLGQLSQGEWALAMDRIIPGFAASGRVTLPSTSSRIRVDGQRTPSIAAHTFVQLVPTDRLDAVWPQFLVKAFQTTFHGVRLGFLKPTRDRKGGTGHIVARVPWSIYDPSTCQPNRLVFDGAPVVKGNGLAVDPPAVQLHEGPRLDLANFPDLADQDFAAFNKHSGGVKTKVDRAHGARVTGIHFVNPNLALNQEVEIGSGAKTTIAEIWTSGARHTRCQTPFRASASEAAYVGVHQDGTPFLIDVGTRTKHTLRKADRKGPPVDAFAVDPARFDESLEAVARAASRHGWSDAKLASLAADIADANAKPLNRRDKAKLRTEILRTFKRTHAAPFDQEAEDDRDRRLAEMNARYAIIKPAGKVLIGIPDYFDPSMRRRHLQIMRPPDFALELANRKVMVPTPKGIEHVPIAKWWLAHADRRQYLGGIALEPNRDLGPHVLNLWRGFTVEPCDGDPSVIVDHICFLASGSGEVAEDYLLNWTAREIQDPGSPAGVAVVLRGAKGVGKGAFGNPMLKLFGTHGFYCSHQRDIAGQFNAHLMNACFVFADECFFAGNRQHESTLKSLITEPYLRVELKGVDMFQALNHVSLFMSSNQEWVVPASKDERRYFVLDVPDDHKGDHAYWQRYWAAVNDPRTLGAFLKYMRERDISSFNVRNVPNTTALDHQKAASLDTEEKWLLDILHRGQGLVMTTTWEKTLPFDVLVTHYELYCAAHHASRYALHREALGRFLSRFFKKTRPHDASGKRVWSYRFGPLHEARARFCQVQTINIQWNQD